MLFCTFHVGDCYLIKAKGAATIHRTYSRATTVSVRYVPQCTVYSILFNATPRRHYFPPSACLMRCLENKLAAKSGYIHASFQSSPHHSSVSACIPNRKNTSGMKIIKIRHILAYHPLIHSNNERAFCKLFFIILLNLLQNNCFMFGGAFLV